MGLNRYKRWGWVGLGVSGVGMACFSLQPSTLVVFQRRSVPEYPRLHFVAHLWDLQFSLLQ